jgi:hypothetical protein
MQCKASTEGLKMRVVVRRGKELTATVSGFVKRLKATGI